jgi:hypothetical protein
VTSPWLIENTFHLISCLTHSWQVCLFAWIEFDIHKRVGGVDFIILYWGISHFRTNNVKWVEMKSFIFFVKCSCVLYIFIFNIVDDDELNCEKREQMKYHQRNKNRLKLFFLSTQMWELRELWITHNETFVQNRYNYTSICLHTRKIIIEKWVWILNVHHHSIEKYPFFRNLSQWGVQKQMR